MQPNNILLDVLEAGVARRLNVGPAGNARLQTFVTPYTPFASLRSRSSTSS
jgi:hypothetical protein